MAAIFPREKGDSVAWRLCAGQHVEHHDFPEIPLTKLPELKRIASEFYDPSAPDYHAYTSWTDAVRGAFTRPQTYGCMAPRTCAPPR